MPRDEEQINEETSTGDSYSGAASSLRSGLRVKMSRRMGSNKQSSLFIENLLKEQLGF